MMRCAGKTQAYGAAHENDQIAQNGGAETTSERGVGSKPCYPSRRATFAMVASPCPKSPRARQNREETIQLFFSSRALCCALLACCPTQNGALMRRSSSGNARKRGAALRCSAKICETSEDTKPFANHQQKPQNGGRVNQRVQRRVKMRPAAFFRQRSYAQREGALSATQRYPDEPQEADVYSLTICPLLRETMSIICKRGKTKPDPQRT